VDESRSFIRGVDESGNYNSRNLDTSLIANLNCININLNPSYFPSLDGRG
jgi:hypothetical protein